MHAWLFKTNLDEPQEIPLYLISIFVFFVDHSVHKQFSNELETAQNEISCLTEEILSLKNKLKVYIPNS